MKISKPLSPNLSLVKLAKVQDKRKWHDRFIKNYKGHTKQASPTIFNDIVSLFFVAKSEANLLGFIRITNYSARYSHLTCWRRLNFDHLCRLNLDQGLLLV